MCRESKIDFSYYDVYEDGRLWSKRWNRWIKGHKSPDGYVRVFLMCNDGRRDCFNLNRVIYFYYKGEIPDNIKVNHIDENKENNAISNLNLMTHKENCNWGTRNERIAKALTGRKNGPHSDETKNHIAIGQRRRFEREGEREKYYKQIWQYKDGELVGVYKSVKEASEKTGFSNGCISSASRGVLNKPGNHKIGEYMFYNEPQL